MQPTRGTPLGKVGRARLIIVAGSAVASAAGLLDCSEGPPITAGDAYGLDVITSDDVRHDASADVTDAADAEPDDAPDGPDDS
jgi:hypothetical protein